MQNISYSKDIYEINHPDMLGKKGFFDARNNDVKIWEMTDESGQRRFRVDIEPKIKVEKEVQQAIKSILDFVERWNKGDGEKKVAEAARVMENYFDKM